MTTRSSGGAGSVGLLRQLVSAVMCRMHFLDLEFFVRMMSDLLPCCRICVPGNFFVIKSLITWEHTITITP